MMRNITAIIKEPGNSMENKKSDWREFKPLINIEKCTKCSICWMNCPDGAIFKTDKGEYRIDYDYCKGCLICVESCPFKAITVEKEEK